MLAERITVVVMNIAAVFFAYVVCAYFFTLVPYLFAWIMSLLFMYAYIRKDATK